MRYLERQIKDRFTYYLEQGYSLLLLGPRQTGKTTFIKHIAVSMSISFIQPRVRLRYERDPSILADEVIALSEQSEELPIVVIDEIQKVPSIMDVIQDLIDNKVAKFILTGSSARKLRRGQVNLLPGRLIVMHLDPFTYDEMKSHPIALNELLEQGALPGIILLPNVQDRDDFLESYVTTYLEEEIRAEAIVRNLSTFIRFLELAACESGKMVNYSKLSQEIGVAHSTIISYYQILEDCLIIESVEPYTQSLSRKKLSKAKKYLFFDLGVRRLCAHEGRALPLDYRGRLFEQFIGLEIIRNLRMISNIGRLRYWRDHDGPEIDWLIEYQNHLVPIEVKLSDAPSLADAKHILTFLKEYPQAKVGYIICTTPHRMKLAENVYAISWQSIKDCLSDEFPQER